MVFHAEHTAKTAMLGNARIEEKLEACLRKN
jgi:hypothetical protein